MGLVTARSASAIRNHSMCGSIYDVYNERRDIPTLSRAPAGYSCSNLGFNEGQSLGAVNFDVLLVSVRIVAVAAVWVSSVAVRLDDAGARR